MFRVDAHLGAARVSQDFFGSYATAVAHVASQLSEFAQMPAIVDCVWLLFDEASGIPVATFGSTDAVIALGIVE